MVYLLEEMEKYAKDNNIPIMLSDGIEFLEKYIKDNNIKSILEVGTAIGYSAIRMCVSDDVKITTIERDEIRYKEAIKNISEKIKRVMESKWRAVEQIQQICKELGTITT